MTGWKQGICRDDLSYGAYRTMFTCQMDTTHAASICPRGKAMKLMALGDAGDLQSPPGANHCNTDMGNSDLLTTAYISMLLLRKQNSRDAFKMHFRFISHIQS